MDKGAAKAFYCAYIMASQEPVSADQEGNKEEQYRKLLADLAEARQDPLFQSLVNPPVEGPVLPSERDQQKKEEDEPVSVVTIRSHEGLPLLTMKLADDPVIHVGEPVACLQQPVERQTPILLVGRLKAILTKEQDATVNIVRGILRREVSLLSL